MPYAEVKAGLLYDRGRKLNQSACMAGASEAGGSRQGRDGHL